MLQLASHAGYVTNTVFNGLTDYI